MSLPIKLIVLQACNSPTELKYGLSLRLKLTPFNLQVELNISRLINNLVLSRANNNNKKKAELMNGTHILTKQNGTHTGQPNPI